VLLEGATPARLWWAVALTYAVSGLVYLFVYRSPSWSRVTTAT